MQSQQTDARLAKQAHDLALRGLHGYVYQQLSTERKDELLQRARERIALWRREQLCSRYYIRFWSSVVNSGDCEVFKAKVLQASERRSTGMMQNTPFSFLLRELR